MGKTSSKRPYGQVPKNGLPHRNAILHTVFLQEVHSIYPALVLFAMSQNFKVCILNFRSMSKGFDDKIHVTSCILSIIFPSFDKYSKISLSCICATSNFLIALNYNINISFVQEFSLICDSYI